MQCRANDEAKAGEPTLAQNGLGDCGKRFCCYEAPCDQNGAQAANFSQSGNYYKRRCIKNRKKVLPNQI